MSFVKRVGWLVVGALFAACGARTGLLGGERDASSDAGVIEAGSDAKPDVADAPPDVPDVRDAPEPFDVVFDGLAPCDPEDLYIYLVTSQKDLYRYRPDTGEFFLVGQLACPSEFGNPFSMGVSRTGIAFVLYTSLGAPGVTPGGRLFAVSTADASCQPTDFKPGQHDFDLFGMGFAIDDDGKGETLYVGNIEFGQTSLGLASIALDTFELTPIGPFLPNVGNEMELTSSDDGQLYGYFLDDSNNGGSVARIDKATGKILDSTLLPIGTNNSALAFAYWGGDFYVFTAPSGDPNSTITRYRPSDGSVTVVGTLQKTVVGAGVTTCTIK